MWIEVLLLATLVSAVLVFLTPDEYAAPFATALSLVPAAISLWLWAAFDGSGNALLAGADVAYESTAQWISLGPYAVEWHVGLDGISVPLVVLTTVLTTLAMLSAWTPIDERESQFYGLVLVTEAALIGLFSSLDFLLWFVFWEAVLVPMFVLIGVWGGPRRRYAAIKFFVYTNVASLVLFVGFFALVFGLGDSVSSLELPAIAQALQSGGLGSLAGIDGPTLRLLAFAAMFFGFAVKMAIFPFHSWLPDAYVEAPTPVTVLLAGVLTKMGTYSMLRFNFTMLPEVAHLNAAWIALFAVATVVYGALVALAQQDLKRIVAYSSLPSIGFILLGLVAYTPHGLGGATFQMVSHGLLAGLLFMAVGLIYRATDTRMLGDLSGLADRLPVTAGLFVAGAFGYMGLPLMSGFAGEVLVFLGSFRSPVYGTAWAAPAFTAVAMFGIVIIAGYYLRALQVTLFGPFELETDAELERARIHDLAPLVVLLVLVVAIGVAPDLIYQMIERAVAPVVTAGGVA